MHALLSVLAYYCLPYLYKTALRLHVFLNVLTTMRIHMVCCVGHSSLQWYVPTLRTWSNSTFTSALSDTRSPAEKTALADELFTRCVELIVAKHRTSMVSCAVSDVSIPDGWQGAILHCMIRSNSHEQRVLSWTMASAWNWSLYWPHSYWQACEAGHKWALTLFKERGCSKKLVIQASFLSIIMAGSQILSMRVHTC